MQMGQALRAGPVLAGKWNAVAHVLPELLRQQTEAPPDSFVSEMTGGIFLIHPSLLAFRRHRMTRPGIVWRFPRRNLIVIKFLMWEKLTGLAKVYERIVGNRKGGATLTTCL